MNYKCIVYLQKFFNMPNLTRDIYGTPVPEIAFLLQRCKKHIIASSLRSQRQARKLIKYKGNICIYSMFLSG